MLTLFLIACTPGDATDSKSGEVDDSGTETTTTTTESGTTSEDPGTWTKYKVDTESSLRGVYSSGDGVYIVGSRGQAWTGSATEAWSALVLPEEIGTTNLNGLWGNGAGETLELAVAADDGWVLTYSAGSWSTWSLGTEDNLGIDGTSISDLTVVGENGIQHFDGTAWSTQALPTVAINAVWAYEDGAIAVGDEGEAMKRDADGAWTSSDTGKAANFYGVAGSSGTDIWAVGDQSVIMHYDGSTWKQTMVDTTDTLNAVFVADTTGVIAVGNDGTALRWDGTSWTFSNADTQQNLYAVHGVSSKNAWTVGNGGLASQYKLN